VDTARHSPPAFLLRDGFGPFFGRLFLLGVIAMQATATELVNVDSTRPGALPEGWIAGVTGKGSHHWAVEPDASAPSRPNVLTQSGTGAFPWCVKPSAAMENGFVEVKFKPLAGKEDQAGGVVWRWKDGDHYYVARGNALEDNVSLYYTEGGSRKTIQYVDAPVARAAWHILRVEFSGRHIKVVLDGVPRIELDDAHIAGGGAVGVWTKADSVTLFDDFGYGPLAAAR
jgi:hypothetical protein